MFSETSSCIFFPYVRTIPMDISQIKKLVKENGDKCIVIENGAPSLVVLSFSEYEKLIEVRGYEKSDAAPRRVPSSYAYQGYETLPNEDGAVRETIPFESAGLPVRLEDIRVEDLPV